MAQFEIDRRSLLRGAAAVAGAASLPAVAGTARARTDPHTRLNYAAVVDAVVPRTPDLAADLGPEHVPGGLEIGLDAYLVTYVNDLFSNLTPVGDRAGNLRLAEAVATLLDEAAVELLARGENESLPSLSHVRDLLDRSTTLDEAVDAATAGPFARLAREDRLDALSLFDEKEVDTTALPGPVVEVSAGLVPTLVVGFTEVVYYSEWQGYAEDMTAPPSEREFAGDPASIQSWRQTDFPGFADGYCAFRGYWGGPDAALGEGEVWKTLPDRGGPPRQITLESGRFRDEWGPEGRRAAAEGYHGVYDGADPDDDGDGTVEGGGLELPPRGDDGDAPEPPELPVGDGREDPAPDDGRGDDGDDGPLGDPFEGTPFEPADALGGDAGW